MCNHDKPWDLLKPPSGTTMTTLTTGQHKTGVNLALGVGGAISGTTFAGAGSTPATSVIVELFRAADGAFITSTYSDFADGTFTFRSLSPKTSGPSTGYVVCFDGRHDFSAPNGYLPQCFNGVDWNGS